MGEINCCWWVFRNKYSFLIAVVTNLSGLLLVDMNTIIKLAYNLIILV